MASVDGERNSSGPARILVAEDEEAITLLLEAVLTGQGYQVETAYDGAEAVHKYQHQGPFDVVILDLQMPRLDGREALAEIRKLNTAARVMVLSGEPLEDENALPAWAKGFDGYLAKPFDNNELVRLVGELRRAQE